LQEHRLRNQKNTLSLFVNKRFIFNWFEKGWIWHIKDFNFSFQLLVLDSLPTFRDKWKINYFSIKIEINCQELLKFPGLDWVLDLDRDI
jgi:hypothetical protein